MQEGRIVTVANFEQEFDAHLARVKLQSEGIACFLSDGNMVNTYGLYTNALGGVKLNVWEKDRQKALEVLGESGYSREPDEVIETETDFVCPNCQSEDIQVPGPSRGWALFAILLLGFPVLFEKKRYLCNACGLRWRR